MKEEGWVQCAQCGHLYKTTVHNLSSEDFYIEQIHCHRCRDETKHIWIGPNKEDIYLYGCKNRYSKLRRCMGRLLSGYGCSVKMRYKAFV